MSPRQRNNLVSSSVSRREFLARAGLLGGAVALGGPALLAACGSSGIKNKSASPGTTGKLTSGCPLPKQSASKQLTISNWPYYIDKKTVKNFQVATGIATSYKEDFNDNEEFYAKYRPELIRCKGIGRDLIVPTDWMVSRMITLGWAAKIDPKNVPNRVNLLDSLQHPSFDPDRSYTMPWQSGMTGIAYNKKLVADLGLQPPKSVMDLLDPKYKGKITFLTEMRDTVGLFMLAQGKDPSKATFANASSAFDVIKKAASSGQVRRFTGNDYGDDLSNGNAVASLAWSGDIPQLLPNNPNLVFVVPEEGGMLFSDNMMILSTSEHVADAEAWINYRYDPVHAAQITSESQYISPVKGSSEELAKIAPKLAKSPLINPPPETQAKLHIFGALSPDVEKQFNTRFQQVQNG
ncbi:MAG: spermidine/putrescine transport system substrate-binding protein [Actinomycetota bacterium]|jgi:spermidine/putrescine transport system substrate-binding protein|nr:spermidine/putrescine transport system substrate-binding protein [Actinomycetota bacterium]